MGIDYMQELTPAICKESGALATKQLIDNRDGRSYWVTKLKDNNCWMTQNLDYDGIGVALSPAGWTTSGTTPAVTNNTAAYYNPGMVGVNNATVSDQHLLVGNYYSWMAATNGTGSIATSDGVNATESICPSNWKLPTKNQFTTLTSGVAAADIVKAPYYFIYGGNVDSGNLSSAGSYGYYWSSTANSGTRAYDLYFDSGNVIPSDNWNRYVGLSVRCLVQGS